MGYSRNELETPSPSKRFREATPSEKPDGVAVYYGERQTTFAAQARGGGVGFKRFHTAHSNREGSRDKTGGDRLLRRAGESTATT